MDGPGGMVFVGSIVALLGDRLEIRHVDAVKYELLRDSRRNDLGVTRPGGVEMTYGGR